MIKIKIWGTRGSIPVSGKEYSAYGGSTTCIEITLENTTHLETPQRLIIDCGSGLASLGRNWQARKNKALFLQTHMHWDHIQGVPFFGPFYNPTAEFDFWAVDRDGFTLREAIVHQMTTPCFPIPIDFLGSKPRFHSIPSSGSKQLGELNLSWVDLQHPSGSTGWRLDYHGNSFVFSGDVEVKLGSRNELIQLAQNADLFVMDAQYLEDEYPSKKGFGHSTAKDAVEVAEASQAKHLLMTHHDPLHNDVFLDNKKKIAKGYVSTSLKVDNARDELELSIQNQTVTASIVLF